MNKPSGGDVWRYHYLWRWQYEAGETEGRKRRPAAFVAALAGQDGGTNLFILAITSTPPSNDRVAVTIPEIECRRAGLDTIPLWIVIDEYNHDILESSAYFEPDGKIGTFSSAFHKKVLAAFMGGLRARKTQAVPRND